MYPKALCKEKVGSYDALAYSGGGYFYDEVLEYRVWVPATEEEAVHFHAFETWEEATEYAQNTPYAKPPLALVLQKAYVEASETGHFVLVEQERIAEWRVEWLNLYKREKGTLEAFIEEENSKK